MEINKALLALALGLALTACIADPTEPVVSPAGPGEFKREYYKEVCIKGVIYYYTGGHGGIAPAYEKSTVPVLRTCGA